MKIKKIIAIVFLLIFGVGVMAYPMLGFPGWNLLKQQSSDIVIVRCTATPDPFNLRYNGMRVEFRGLMNSKIEMVSVLKGATNSGARQMTTSYWPRQGEYYLLFANYRDGFYDAGEAYRVVPLGPHFLTNGLAGKSLDQQVDMLFHRRVDDLNAEMKKAQAEKHRLEQAFLK